MEDQFASGLLVCGKSILANDHTLHPAEHYKERITEIIRSNGLTVVGEPQFVDFSDDSSEITGFTVLCCLAESHVTLHTWFERCYVDIDVFTCNARNDQACERTFDQIAALFEPVKVLKHKLPR